MKQDVEINLPDGFRLFERESKLDVTNASTLLLSKKKRNLTSAVRSGDEATITWHVIECPFCRRQFPAYYRYVGKAPPVSRDTILKWAEPQYTLFEDAENKLVFNNIYNPEEIYMCPGCGQESRPFHENYAVHFSTEKWKLKVSCSSTDLKSVLALAKTTELKFNQMRFPLLEELELNLRNGHSSIRIKDRDDNTILVLDITSGRTDWSCTTVYKLIDTSNLMKRKLRKAFGLIYRWEIPFGVNEMSPSNAVSMTRFRGFPREFYDSIPYNLSDGRIERSFVSLAKRIHEAHDLQILLENSTLPKTKSVKRVMFSTPGFFFYLLELEKLWAIIKDINCFIRVLESSNAFIMLAHLHQYPRALIFWNDYCNVKGAVNLYSLISKKWREVAEYSLHYCSMSRDARIKEHENWRHVKSSLEMNQGHSVPMPTGSRAIKDCTIDGFSFIWLRTRNEFIRAGNALNNCLKDWSPYMNPVVAIKQNSRIIAAVEVLDHDIVQARIFNNSSIRCDKKLYAAYEKWKRRYSLIDSPEFIDFDFDE